jgi:AraC-like DNA-binding protein
MLYDCPKYKIKKSIDIDSITSIHYFEFDDKFVDTPESHDPWELVYVDRGECDIVADNETFRLKQGQMYFHKPNEYHAISTKDFANSIIVSFECHSPAMKSFEDKKATLTELEKALLRTIVKEGNACFSDKLNEVHLRKLNRAKSAPFGAEQMIKTSIEQLLILLIRRTPDNEKVVSTSKSAKSLAERIQQILIENVYTEISLSRIANELFFSVTYVKSTFKKSTGKTVMQYFAELKIEEAKKLISQDCYTFMEIAYKLGYSSLHYFSRQFKKVTSMTPTQYAKTVKLEGVL